MSHACVLISSVDADTLLLANYLPIYGNIMRTTLQIYTHVNLKIVPISDYHHHNIYVGRSYVRL